MSEADSLRKQLLQASIQNAMLTQQFQQYAIDVNRYINELKAKIPKKHEIEAIVSEKNFEERKQLQDLRNDCIVQLKKLRSASNA